MNEDNTSNLYCKVITNVTPSRASIEESKWSQKFSYHSLYFLLLCNLIVKVKLSVSINEKLFVSKISLARDDARLTSKVNREPRGGSRSFYDPRESHHHQSSFLRQTSILVHPAFSILLQLLHSICDESIICCLVYCCSLSLRTDPTHSILIRSLSNVLLGVINTQPSIKRRRCCQLEDMT